MSKATQLLRIIADRVERGLISESVAERALSGLTFDGGIYKNGLLKHGKQLRSFSPSRVKKIEEEAAPKPAPVKPPASTRATSAKVFKSSGKVGGEDVKIRVEKTDTPKTGL